jgi:hypothetical protein
MARIVTRTTMIAKAASNVGNKEKNDISLKMK